MSEGFGNSCNCSSAMDLIIADGVINDLKSQLDEKDKRIKELEEIIKDNCDGIEILTYRQCEIFNEIVG